MTKVRPPGTLPAAFLAGATPRAREALRDLLREAGIRMRLEEGRIAFRSDPSPPPLVTTKCLQRKDDGALRADAPKTIRAGDLLSDEQASNAAEEFRRRYAEFIPGTLGKADKMAPTSFDALQMELMWNDNEMPIVERWVKKWGTGVRVFRVTTTRALHLRDMFWRLATAHLQEGLSLQAMIDEGRWPQLNQISGNVLSQAAIWMVAPMAARVQPFAAAFSTVRGAELVAIPQGAWNRDSYQPLLWPVGFGGLRLGGSGEGAYAREGDTTIPHSVATDLLDEQREGVNRLMFGLTDPGAWTTGTIKEVNIEERNIAWSSVNLGLVVAVIVIYRHRSRPTLLRNPPQWHLLPGERG